MPLSEKQPPVISGEEDTPLTEVPDGIETNAVVERELPKEKDAEKWMERQKFSLGSTTLRWCIALMVGCILLSIFWPERELVQSGFEAFKMIVMTILVY